MMQLDKTIMELFADVNFVVCFFVLEEVKYAYDGAKSCKTVPQWAHDVDVRL